MRPLEMQAFAVVPDRTLKQYIAALERKSLLRFMTCGSVDDGKSTLIGRLLYD
jgi:bifunctional enzyme CysN/CysC